MPKYLLFSNDLFMTPSTTFTAIGQITVLLKIASNSCEFNIDFLDGIATSLIAVFFQYFSATARPIEIQLVDCRRLSSVTFGLNSSVAPKLGGNRGEQSLWRNFVSR